MENGKRWVVYGTELGIPEICQFGFDDLRRAVNLPEHAHSGSFEFVYIESGRAGWETEKGFFETRTGDVFHTRPNEVHKGGYNVIEPCRLWWVILNIPPVMKKRTEPSQWLRMSSSEYEALVLALWRLPRVRHVGPHLSEHFRRMKKAWSKNDSLSRLEIKTVLTDFFLKLLQPESKHSLPDGLNQDIRWLLERMNKSPEWNPRLDELAGMVNVSPSYFHRIFQTSTGLTPKAYMNRIKIAAASRLLKETDLSVMDISLRLGYATTQHFATAFRRMVGQSPTQWRCDEQPNIDFE